jgi:threonine/homoserine/homoserine lactone efflux protein
MSFFLRGLLIGFSIAAPVGPIGVICIRRALTKGRLSGFISGLGAASADAIYGSIAAFGLTAVSSFLVDQQAWLRFIGGLFLCYLAWRTLIAQPSEQTGESAGKTLVGDYTSTFFLTLTNPLTILSFAAIFAGLGIASAQGDLLHASFMVGGVFCGSAVWWLMLSSGVSLFRRRFSPLAFVWVNRISGSIIFAFGLWALWSWAGAL